MLESVIKEIKVLPAMSPEILEQIAHNVYVKSNLD